MNQWIVLFVAMGISVILWLVGTKTFSLQVFVIYLFAHTGWALGNEFANGRAAMFLYTFLIGSGLALLFTNSIVNYSKKEMSDFIKDRNPNKEMGTLMKLSSWLFDESGWPIVFFAFSMGMLSGIWW